MNGGLVQRERKKCKNKIQLKTWRKQTSNRWWNKLEKSIKIGHDDIGFEDVKWILWLWTRSNNRMFIIRGGEKKSFWLIRKVGTFLTTWSTCGSSKGLRCTSSSCWVRHVRMIVNQVSEGSHKSSFTYFKLPSCCVLRTKITIIQ